MAKKNKTPVVKQLAPSGPHESVLQSRQKHASDRAYYEKRRKEQESFRRETAIRNKAAQQRLEKALQDAPVSAKKDTGPEKDGWRIAGLVFRPQTEEQRRLLEESLAQAKARRPAGHVRDRRAPELNA